MVGGLSVACCEVTSGTGMACTKSRVGTSGNEELVLSRLRSWLRWVSAAQGASLVLLPVLSPMSHVEQSSILMSLPPGSCTNLRLSLVPMSLALLSIMPMSSLLSRGCLPSVLLSLLSVLSSLLCDVLPLMSQLSGWLWLFLGTCAGSGFVIGVASPFFTLEVSCSCIWRLFGLILVASDGLGGAAVIDEGRGSGSS